jgi:hypothetical protein
MLLQKITYIIAVDVACRFDGHNVSVFIENLERHRTVVFAFRILVKVEADEFFSTDFLKKKRKRKGK